MQKFLIGIGVTITLLWSISFAHGQKETGRYIPLGQSPGLSNKYTLMGAVEMINVQEQTISVAGPSGTQIIKITDHTKIWLDRTKLKLTNLMGSSADLQKGLMVEVKFEDHERKEFADWIKVQITETSTGEGGARE